MSVRRNLLAGLTMLAIGGTILLLSREYSFGTTRQLGSGFFPTVFSICLMVLGAIIAFFLADDEEGGALLLSMADLRAGCCVIGGPLVFALMLPRTGAIPAAFCATLMVSYAARSDTSVVSRTISSILISLLCALIFIVGLNMPFRMFGS